MRRRFSEEVIMRRWSVAPVAAALVLSVPAPFLAARAPAMAEEAKAAGVETVYAVVPGGIHLEAFLTSAREFYDFLDQHKIHAGDAEPRTSNSEAGHQR
jgi:acetyl esterase/lipase